MVIVKMRMGEPLCACFFILSGMRCSHARMLPVMHMLMCRLLMWLWLYILCRDLRRTVTQTFLHEATHHGLCNVLQPHPLPVIHSSGALVAAAPPAFGVGTCVCFWSLKYMRPFSSSHSVHFGSTCLDTTHLGRPIRTCSINSLAV